jgi:hypothetical protein
MTSNPMKTFIRALPLVAFLLIGAGCAAQPAPVAPPAPVPPVANAPVNAPRVGGDRDAHGCIGSAGYSWCEAKQKCLRPWEEKCEAAGATVPTTVLASTADARTYCNGDAMDSEGFRKTITKEMPFTPSTDADEAVRLEAVVAASTTGMCKTALQQAGLTVKDGVATIGQIDGWAGVSIVMCSCKPLVEVNLLRQPGIARVAWQ